MKEGEEVKYPTEDQVYNVTVWITTPLFVGFAVLLISALKKYKIKNFDPASVVLLFAFLLCMGIKAIFILYYTIKQSLSKQDYGHFRTVINIMNIFVDISVWCMLFLIVFEMQKVEHMIRKKREKENYREPKPSVKVREWGFIALVLVFRMMFHTFDILKMVEPTKTFDKIRQVAINVSIVGRVLYLVMLMIGLILWFKIIVFFYRERKAR